MTGFSGIVLLGYKIVLNGLIHGKILDVKPSNSSEEITISLPLSVSVSAVHRSDPGRARGRAGHGGRSQRDLGTERGGKGEGHDHDPEFPTAQRLLFLLVLLLQLLMVGHKINTYTHVYY